MLKEVGVKIVIEYFNSFFDRNINIKIYYCKIVYNLLIHSNIIFKKFLCKNIYFQLIYINIPVAYSVQLNIQELLLSEL